MTKVCIFGAGAIGGYLGAMIAKSGAADVSLIARGPHLKAIKENGLALKMDGEDYVSHPRATDTPSDLGPQDFVIVTLKAHAIPALIDALKPLIGENTAIVFALNGIPWWYFHNVEGPYKDRHIEAVDPGGNIGRALDPSRAIGCVVYAATEVQAPGIIKHTGGNRFTLGEPSGEKTDRIKELARILIASGIRAPIRPRIREEIWIKLWGNCAFNPLSILTHATLEDMCLDPGVRAFARDVMLETECVANALGIKFPIDVDQRLEGTQAVGAHKTSMLQDLERGRTMEIDALVTAVQELGTMTSTKTPNLDTLLALARQRARTASTDPV